MSAQQEAKDAALQAICVAQNVPFAGARQRRILDAVFPVIWKARGEADRAAVGGRIASLQAELAKTANALAESVAEQVRTVDGASARITSVEAERDEARAVIEQVRAKLHTVEYYEAKPYKALDGVRSVIEALDAAPPSALDAVKADAWEEGWAARAKFWVSHGRRMPSAQAYTEAECRGKFDRWLAGVASAAKAEALEEAAKDLEDEGDAQDAADMYVKWEYDAARYLRARAAVLRETGAGQ